MATVVEKIPGGSRRGAWWTYADGQMWRLVQGIDYEKCTTVRCEMYRVSGRQGKRAHVKRRIEDGQEVMYVQAIPKTNGGPTE